MSARNSVDRQRAAPVWPTGALLPPPEPLVPPEAWPDPLDDGGAEELAEGDGAAEPPPTSALQPVRATVTIAPPQARTVVARRRLGFKGVSSNSYLSGKSLW